MHNQPRLDASGAQQAKIVHGKNPDLLDVFCSTLKDSQFFCSVQPPFCLTTCMEAFQLSPWFRLEDCHSAGAEFRKYTLHRRASPALPVIGIEVPSPNSHR